MADLNGYITDIVEEVMLKRGIPLFTRFSRNATCLNYRLDRKIRCNSCSMLYEKFVEFPNRKTPTSGRRIICERPWNSGFEKHDWSSKSERYELVMNAIRTVTGTVPEVESQPQLRNKESSDSSSSSPPISSLDENDLGNDALSVEEEDLFTPPAIAAPDLFADVTPGSATPCTNSKKRKRTSDINSALQLIHPRKNPFNTEHSWENSETTLSTKSHRRYASDILQHLKVVTKGKLEHAAVTLGTLIRKPVFDSVRKLLEEQIIKKNTDVSEQEQKLDRRIVNNIKKCLEHHEVGGVRQKETQKSIDALITAICFADDDEVFSNKAIRRRLGCTYSLIKKGREAAKKMMTTGKELNPSPRKTRKDYIQPEARRCIVEFCRSDDYSRIDTNCFKTIKVKCPHTEEEEELQRRIWLVVGLDNNFELFSKSEIYNTFLLQYPGHTIGRTVFFHNLCPSVTDPKPESCVDEKTSAVQHYMTCILTFLRRPNVKEELKNYVAPEGGLNYDETVDVLKRARAGDIIEAVCCRVEEHSDLQFCQTVSAPKLIPYRCTHGTCQDCGIHKRLTILQHPTLKDNPMLVQVHEWDEGTRQGTKRGRPATQRELTQRVRRLSDILISFRQAINTCIPHYQDILWIRQVMKNDIRTLPDNTLLVFTDFSATLVLRALEAKNSSVDAHAVLDNFVCLYKRRKAKVKEKDKEEEVEIFTCDVHHFFADTISAGKK